MKRAFLLILLLVPVVVFGQIAVVDGPDLEIDIDSQSSTTLYLGTFNAPESIWDGYTSNNKFYICELVQQGVSEPITLIGITYPDVITSSPPAVPYTIEITDADLFENTDGTYDQLEPGETYYLKVIAYVATTTFPFSVVVAEGQSDGVT